MHDLALTLFWLWPWWGSAEHLALLALLGTVLVEVSVYGFHKIPFTCSYLPGKANVYVVFVICVPMAVPLLIKIVGVEQNALRSAGAYSVLAVGMIFAAVAAKFGTAALARAEGAALRFDETERPPIEGLDLHKDGIVTIRSRPE